jgi:hypothetical protein
MLHSSYGTREVDIKGSNERLLNHVESYKRIKNHSKKVIPLAKMPTSKSQKIMQ